MPQHCLISNFVRSVRFEAVPHQRSPVIYSNPLPLGSVGAILPRRSEKEKKKIQADIIHVGMELSHMRTIKTVSI